MSHINEMYLSIKESKNKAFFVIDRSFGKFIHKTLSETISIVKPDENFAEYSEESVWFGFSDPSCSANAGWPARSFLCMLALLWLVIFFFKKVCLICFYYFQSQTTRKANLLICCSLQERCQSGGKLDFYRATK